MNGMRVSGINSLVLTAMPYVIIYNTHFIVTSLKQFNIFSYNISKSK